MRDLLPFGLGSWAPSGSTRRGRKEKEKRRRARMVRTLLLEPLEVRHLQFTYDPRWYDYSLAEYAGSFTLNYRTVEFDASYNAVTGSWQSLSFTLETPAAPEISVVCTDAYGYEQEAHSGYDSVRFGSTPVDVPSARRFPSSIPVTACSRSRRVPAQSRAHERNNQHANGGLPAN